MDVCYELGDLSGAKEFVERHMDIIIAESTLVGASYYFAKKPCGELIAVACIAPNHSLNCAWHLPYLVTHPDYRGRGIMTTMVAALCNGKKGGILAEAWAKGGIPNIQKVLLRTGFTQVGVLKDYWRITKNCNCKVACSSESICDNHLYVKVC